METENVELTDNSDVATQEPEVTDNSESADTAEPEQSNEESETAQSKFKTLEEAVRGYSELEKKLGENSKELGELRKQAELATKLQEQIDSQKLQEANDKGFETVEDFTNYQEVTNFQANEYAKHLNEVEFPDEMQNLLNEYKKNPSAELLNTIEAEFPLDTVKQVAGSLELYKGQLQAQQLEAQEKQVYDSAQQYLANNVEKYRDQFNNPAFAQLYGEAFKAYGCNLDTDAFVQLMQNYADSVIKANGIQKSIDNENQSATDEIAGVTQTGNSQPRGSEKNILDMTEAEMRAEIKKYRL